MNKSLITIKKTGPNGLYEKIVKADVLKGLAVHKEDNQWHITLVSAGLKLPYFHNKKKDAIKMRDLYLKAYSNWDSLTPDNSTEMVKASDAIRPLVNKLRDGEIS